jgi:hypothetical protein
MGTGVVYFSGKCFFDYDSPGKIEKMCTNDKIYKVILNYKRVWVQILSKIGIIILMIFFPKIHELSII